MEAPVPHHSDPLRPGDLAAALAWWRDAGVDLDFADGPTRWLAPAAPSGNGSAAALPDTARRPEAAAAAGTAPAASAALVAPAAPLGGDPSHWPDDLPGFARWWLEEPSLDDGQLAERVPPRGVAAPAVMILVPQPEAGDRETLLGGPEGALLAAILGAMGIDRDSAYIAAVLPRHTPMVDWAALATRGAGALLAHHIGLVRPQRLIVFGASILPLLGHTPTHNAQTLPSFNHHGGSVPLLAARELGALLARPAWKAGFWRTWLDWTGTTTA